MRYDPDDNGVGKLLLHTKMGQAMHAVARRGADYAASIAPIESGDYANSFDTATEIIDKRQTGIIVNTAGYAAAVEWGTDDTAGQHVLGRTIDFIEASSR